MTKPKIDIHSRDDIDPWLKSAHPGQRACYFVGHLAWARETRGQDRIEHLAQTLYRLSIGRKVHLVQERCKGGFRYLVIKAHRKQTGREMVREEREPVFRGKYRPGFGRMGITIVETFRSNSHLSNDQIADLCGTTKFSVATTLSRARKAGVL